VIEVSWNKASLRAVCWAAGALLLAALAFLFTLEVPGPGGGLAALVAVPVLASIVAALVHRDVKVLILTALFALLLAAAFWVVFVAIALTGLHGA
jgi:hypothetical protein